MNIGFWIIVSFILGFLQGRKPKKKRIQRIKKWIKKKRDKKRKKYYAFDEFHGLREDKGEMES